MRMQKYIIKILQILYKDIIELVVQLLLKTSVNQKTYLYRPFRNSTLITSRVVAWRYTNGPWPWLKENQPLPVGHLETNQSYQLIF